MILADSGLVTGFFTLGGVAITLTVGAILEATRRKHENQHRWSQDKQELYTRFLAAAVEFEGLKTVEERVAKLDSLEDVWLNMNLLGSEDVFQAAFSYTVLAVLYHRAEDWNHRELFTQRELVRELMRKDLGLPPPGRLGKRFVPARHVWWKIFGSVKRAEKRERRELDEPG